jgi:alkaline phosphatase D
MTLPVWEIVDLQDYRNRYATYHLDEGLQNLRRRAPMMSTWDDHETTNNSYGQGEVSNTGAENHQVTCPVNRTSTAEEKNNAGCDRDEGNIKIRLTNAAQAYMEWLPLRRGPGSMGVVDFTSITQVVEWGKLATFVSVDTRITDRSEEPTLGSAFNPFAGYAYGQTNMSSYYDPNSEVAQTFEVIGAGILEANANPEFTMVGEDNFDFIMDVFADSKAEDKTWQIFTAA